MSERARDRRDKISAATVHDLGFDVRVDGRSDSRM